MWQPGCLPLLCVLHLLLFLLGEHTHNVFHTYLSYEPYFRHSSSGVVKIYIQRMKTGIYMNIYMDIYMDKYMDKYKAALGLHQIFVFSSVNMYIYLFIEVSKKISSSCCIVLVMIF